MFHKKQKSASRNQCLGIYRAQATPSTHYCVHKTKHELLRMHRSVDCLPYRLQTRPTKISPHEADTAVLSTENTSEAKKKNTEAKQPPLKAMQNPTKATHASTKKLHCPAIGSLLKTALPFLHDPPKSKKPVRVLCGKFSSAP